MIKMTSAKLNVVVAGIHHTSLQAHLHADNHMLDGTGQLDACVDRGCLSLLDLLLRECGHFLGKNHVTLRQVRARCEAEDRWAIPDAWRQKAGGYSLITNLRDG